MPYALCPLLFWVPICPFSFRGIKFSKNPPYQSYAKNGQKQQGENLVDGQEPPSGRLVAEELHEKAHEHVQNHVKREPNRFSFVQAVHEQEKAGEQELKRRFVQLRRRNEFSERTAAATAVVKAADLAEPDSDAKWDHKPVTESAAGNPKGRFVEVHAEKSAEQPAEKTFAVPIEHRLKPVSEPNRQLGSKNRPDQYRREHATGNAAIFVRKREPSRHKKSRQ